MKTIGAVLLALLFFAVFWPGSGKNFVEVSVAEGQSAYDVAQMLKDNGLVKSTVPFRAWTKLRRAGSKIQIGRYRFSQGRSSFWLVDDLVQGRVEKVRVVIPEGFSSWQIAERLESLKVCDGDAFKVLVSSDGLEGYLFPATYDFVNGMSPQRVVRKFLDEFESRWTPEIQARTQELAMTKHQVVTLASILQREVRRTEELPMVSAVYHNRLKKKMRLEADPTVQYALGFWKTRLRYNDYKTVNSPYNTYLNSGLPPGPICSPGEAAIHAALWPAESSALFLLAMDDGYHTFSDTYREHTNKVNKRNRMKR